MNQPQFINIWSGRPLQKWFESPLNPETPPLLINRRLISPGQTPCHGTRNKTGGCLTSLYLYISIHTSKTHTCKCPWSTWAYCWIPNGNLCHPSLVRRYVYPYKRCTSPSSKTHTSRCSLKLHFQVSWRYGCLYTISWQGSIYVYIYISFQSIFVGIGMFTGVRGFDSFDPWPYIPHSDIPKLQANLVPPEVGTVVTARWKGTASWPLRCIARPVVGSSGSKEGRIRKHRCPFWLSLVKNRRHWCGCGLFHLPGPSIFPKGHLTYVNKPFLLWMVAKSMLQQNELTRRFPQNTKAPLRTG